MMNDLYRIIFYKDAEAKAEMFHLLVIILSFIVGVGVSATVIEWNPAAILWIAFGTVSLCIFALFFYKWT